MKGVKDRVVDAPLGAVFSGSKILRGTEPPEVWRLAAVVWQALKALEEK